MWLTERGFANAAILDVHGSLTGTAASDLLQTTVRTHLAGGAPMLILNLADVSDIDTEGINALTALHAATRAFGPEVRIAGPPGDLPSLPVRTYPSVDDALTDIRGALERRQSRLLGGTLERALTSIRAMFRRT